MKKSLSIIIKFVKAYKPEPKFIKVQKREPKFIKVHKSVKVGTPVGKKSMNVNGMSQVEKV